MNRPLRERLDRQVAEDRYLRAGELETFKQIRRDAHELDATLSTERARALGPFGRMRADEVVRTLGKTRGAINNVWRSQETFRAEAMAFSLSADSQDGLGMSQTVYPDPAKHKEIDGWITELAIVELARGPRHGMEPNASYALRWASWLGLVPYGLWSEAVADASLTEYRLGVESFVSPLLQSALDHFELVLAEGTTITDLAVAVASAIEGFWLSACVSLRDPAGRPQSIEASLATCLKLLIRGAIADRG